METLSGTEHTSVGREAVPRPESTALQLVRRALAHFVNHGIAGLTICLVVALFPIIASRLGHAPDLLKKQADAILNHLSNPELSLSNFGIFVLGCTLCITREWGEAFRRRIFRRVWTFIGDLSGITAGVVLFVFCTDRAAYMWAGLELLIRTEALVFMVAMFAWMTVFGIDGLVTKAAEYHARNDEFIGYMLRKKNYWLPVFGGFMIYSACKGWGAA